MERSERPWAWPLRIAIGAALLGAGILMGRSSILLPALGPPRLAKTDAPPRAADPARRRPHEGHAPWQPSPDPEPPPPAETVPPAESPRPDTPPQAGAFLEVRGGALTLHERPDETSPVVGTIPDDDAVRVLERSDDAPGYLRVARMEDETLAGWVQWSASRLPRVRREGVYGTGTIHGVVRFTGKAPVMPVPKKRLDAYYCKDHPVPVNAVVVHDERLQDVFVGVNGDLGYFRPPETPIAVGQTDCTYTPRIQGALHGQAIELYNADRTLHNVHTYRGKDSWFNQPQPKGSPPILKELPEETKIIKLTCDVHPWMRAFVVLWHSPFFAVSRADGSFAIERVPAGRHGLSIWHSHYGKKTARVTVAEGGTADVTITYDGTEPEPPENEGELKGL